MSEPQKPKRQRKVKPPKDQKASKPFAGHPMDWLALMLSDPKRNSSAIRVAVGLAGHVNRKRRDNCVWPSVGTLAREVGLKKRSVEVYLTDLVLDGFLQRTRRGQNSNFYTLSEPDDNPQQTADLDAQPTADRKQSKSADSSGSKASPDPQFDVAQSAARRISDPQSAVAHIEEPEKEPEKEPLEDDAEGAALQAPAQPPVAHSPSSTNGPVLRAADAASDGPLPRCRANTSPAPGFLPPDAAELLELIGNAERYAESNPDLTRRDYHSPKLTEAEALAVYRSSPRSARLREDADAIVDLAGLTEDTAPEDVPAIVELVRLLQDSPLPDAIPDLAVDMRERALRARKITLRKAALVAAAENICGVDMDDDSEVPF